MSDMKSTTHDRLAKALRSMVRAGLKPGDQLPTIIEMRKRFGVSVNTVRTALLILQAEGLVELRQGSGCFVREPRRATRHVALLSDYNLLSSKGSHFHRELFAAIRNRLKERDLPSRFYIGTQDDSQTPTRFSCTELLDDLALDRIAGVIAVATLVYPEWVDACRKCGAPIVSEDTNPSLRAIASTVEIDDSAVIEEGVRILTSQGRRRIALLAWGATSRPGATVLHFRSALGAAGIAYHPEWVRGEIPPAVPGAGWEQFREIWAGRAERPDGLVATDDMLFDDARKAIQEMGIRVPDQLAIVTHANRNSNVAYPFPVTRLEFDPEEFAAVMVDQLAQRLAGSTPEQPHIRLPYRIREPAHSAPVAANALRV
jgi:GntR family transcriptional regulator